MNTEEEEADWARQSNETKGKFKTTVEKRLLAVVVFILLSFGLIVWLSINSCHQDKEAPCPGGLPEQGLTIE